MNKSDLMDFDNTYDPERWEGYYELYENEDWVGLLKLCEIDAKNIQLICMHNKDMQMP